MINLNNTENKKTLEKVEQDFNQVDGACDIKSLELTHKRFDKLIDEMSSDEDYVEVSKNFYKSLTKKVKEMEEFIEEQRYNSYVSELKNKYSDFDEDKVLEYAEKHDVLNLEVAYKAMKADSVKEPNMEELRKQIKEELLNELKQNSLETQSIVGGMSQKPIKQDDTVNLSSRESRIAKAMGMTPSEYAKWR